MRRAGQGLLALVVLGAAAAPWLAPNPPDRTFPAALYAPPTPVRLRHAGLRAPFIYPQRVVSALERRFEEDATRPVPLQWFRDGRLVTVPDAGGGPLLLLGADSLGRDTFSRLLYGARTSLVLAAASTLLALLVGALIGGIAGYAGGVADETLSRLTDFVLVLPAMYVALALRAVMPLVLPPATVFALLTAIFALLGWPVVARGVRAIVASEREREYVVAGRALGATPSRLLARYLLPAAGGYLAVQATLLLPAFILAEATLSYVGLGFPATVPTWGTMLQEAANVSLLGGAPWVLAPAAAIFVVVLAVNLVVQGTGRAPVQLEP
ncbi:MAG: ABC transporter permease [Acidobacteria bacterium]|nr:ABC transporter permease [Acidobacteriota bacterium]